MGWRFSFCVTSWTMVLHCRLEGIAVLAGWNNAMMRLLWHGLVDESLKEKDEIDKTKLAALQQTWATVAFRIRHCRLHNFTKTSIDDQ